MQGTNTAKPGHLPQSVHLLIIPSPASWLSLLTVEQEGFRIKPETLTTGYILIVKVLSHNAKHQLFTHHVLHEAIIFSWNSKLQVIGYRGVFSTGGQTGKTDRQTTDVIMNKRNHSEAEAQTPVLALTLP